MALYAGFAGNLDPADMARKLPNSPAVGPGWLMGWRLTFGGEEYSWQGPLPTVVEDPDSQVFVMLYALSDSDEHNLDEKEGFQLGHYRKLHVRVSTLDGEETAWVYAMQGYESGHPRQAVLDKVVNAAIAAGAPDEYIESIRAWPVADAE